MSKGKVMNLLTIIGLSSKRIRARLANYGISQQECNGFFRDLLSDHQGSACPSVSSQNSKESSQQQERPLKIETIIKEGLKRHKKDPQRYLVGLIGKLEVQYRQLQEYEKNQQNLLKSFSELEECKEKSIGSEEKSSAKSIEDTLSVGSGEEMPKQPRQSSAQIERLQRQERMLKCSLQTMIEKTKILRAMLQRQILLKSMGEMEDLAFIPSERFVSLGGFAM